MYHRFNSDERYRIQLPTLTPIKEDNSLKIPYEVTHDSPIAYRKAVEKIGRYWEREGDFQCGIPYDHEYKYENEKAVFLWTAPTTIERFIKNEDGWHDVDILNKAIAYGACGFDYKDKWQLAWIWIHPYERRKGVLTKAWDYFYERFSDEKGHVDVHYPNESMLLFLEKDYQKRGVKPPWTKEQIDSYRQYDYLYQKR